MVTFARTGGTELRNLVATMPDIVAEMSREIGYEVPMSEGIRGNQVQHNRQ